MVWSIFSFEFGVLYEIANVMGKELYRIVEEECHGDLKLDLYKVYQDARKNKRRTKSQVLFEMHLVYYLTNLYRELTNGRYKVGRHMYFIIEDPVKLDVFVASFSDMGVHNLLYNYIQPVMDKKFIYDSYSCREGKDVLMGKLDHNIRSCSDNYRNSVWVLIIDVSGYFMSLDRDLLFQRILGMLDGEEYRHKELVHTLLWKIIFSDTTKGCYHKGRVDDWKDLPASKSLFTAKGGCLLSIGNLTSQLFSNVYLSALYDNVKRELKFKHYGRYVDDFYVVNCDRECLREAIDKIKSFLWNKLRLILYPKKTYLQDVGHGVQFLGAVVKSYRIYVSNRTRNRFYEWFSDVKLIEYAFSSLNPYLGYLVHFKSYGLRKNLALSHS